MTQNRKETIKRVIFTTAIVHIGLGFWFIERGLINADEGWYLYAARQMGSGLEPYQDFAFFQAPVYPRVLSGLLESGPGSLIAGRWLSWFMLVVGVCTVGLAAKRISGLKGSMIAMICMGLNPLVVSTGVLAKPYGLAIMLLAVGLFFMAGRDRLRTGIGFFLFGLAVGVRLSLLVPVAVLIWSHRKTRLVESAMGSMVGMCVALTPLVGVDPHVLWENLIAVHVDDGGEVTSRMQWAVWQVGFCGFFLVGFLHKHRTHIPGLHWAVLFGILVHAIPAALHVEHAVIMMPLMALALAEMGSQVYRSKTIFLGGVAVVVSMATGARWVHLDRGNPTVHQAVELGHWVAERTDPRLPLLTTQLILAVEADRSVCEGFEMGQFGWSPDMTTQRARALRRLNRSGLDGCFKAPLGGVMVAESDLSSTHRDWVVQRAIKQFGHRRTVDGYGQFSESLEILVPVGEVLWTE